MDFKNQRPENIFGYPHPILEEIEINSKKEGIPLLSRGGARAIYQLCAMLAPKKVLELGCGIGYSSAWLACAMTEGEIHLSDYNNYYLQRSSELIGKINPNISIRTFVGESTSFLEQSRDEYDLIFIDIDKLFYKRALDFALPRLSKRSLLIFDNAYFSGRTFSATEEKKVGVDSIRATILTLRSLDLVSNLWDVGDGLLVAFRSQNTDKI